MKHLLKLAVCLMPGLLFGGFFENIDVGMAFGITWGGFCGWYVWPEIDRMSV